MKGLEQARHYFEGCGEPVLARLFPECWDRVAVGLAGEGSECFGYDDAISTDHDFGAGFCLWLTGEDAAAYGQAMADAYASLPERFDGLVKRPYTPTGGQRVGVCGIDTFFTRLTGCAGVPASPRNWLMIEDYQLAAATNGEVFRDPLGRFTQIREELKAGYPEDVRMKKLAYQVHLMSQAGQYNYARCMMRGDEVTAAVCLAEFAKGAMQAAYLINKRYAPYYKWMHRGLAELKELAELGPMLTALFKAPDQRGHWQGTDPERWKYQINTEDDCVRMIEQVCVKFRHAFEEMGISYVDSDFLDHHYTQILANIGDDAIRNL